MKKINKRQFGEALDYLDADMIDEYLDNRQKYLLRKKRRPLFKKAIALAACALIIAGIVFAVPLFSIEQTYSDEGKEYSTLEAYKEALDTAKVKVNIPTYVLGAPSVDNVQSAPPAFQFDLYNFVVKAKAIEIYPDTYGIFSLSTSIEMQKYRVIKMQTLETLRGENMPEYFLYLLPESLYVDMTVYDCLVLSLYQKGTAGYVAVNQTEGRAQKLDMPVFESYNTELGNVIAFTDGVFDESLWQTESWTYGYQFGKHYLDYNDDYLFVKRGESCDTVSDRIKSAIACYTALPPVCVQKLDFAQKDACDALSYVEFSDSNVFLQVFSQSEVTFIRYICGCRTDESVSIDLETEQVTFSNATYSDDDMRNLPDISSVISDLAEEYRLDLPHSPHIDKDGKKLISLRLYGMYIKKGGKQYAVITTSWEYMQTDDYYIRYYDDSFVLYDISNRVSSTVTREQLVDIIGYEYLIWQQAEYGVPVEIPTC